MILGYRSNHTRANLKPPLLRREQFLHFSTFSLMLPSDLHGLGKEKKKKVMCEDGKKK